MLITAVQQSDSVIHTYILFHFLFHYGLSQDIEYSSLCYTVEPCCLFYFLFFSFFFWLRWVFVAAHGLFSSLGEWGLLFVVVRGLLLAMASIVAERRL